MIVILGIFILLAAQIPILCCCKGRVFDKKGWHDEKILSVQAPFSREDFEIPDTPPGSADPTLQVTQSEKWTSSRQKRIQHSVKSRKRFPSAFYEDKTQKSSNRPGFSAEVFTAQSESTAFSVTGTGATVTPTSKR